MRENFLLLFFFLIYYFRVKPVYQQLNQSKCVVNIFKIFEKINFTKNLKNI